MDSSSYHSLDLAHSRWGSLRTWICPITGEYSPCIDCMDESNLLTCAIQQLVYPIYKNTVYGAGLGASSFAIDVFMRYSLSCVFPLFTIPLIDHIGFDWVMTTCVLVMIALIPVPWWLQKHGALLRRQSPYLNSLEHKMGSVMVEST